MERQLPLKTNEPGERDPHGLGEEEQSEEQSGTGAPGRGHRKGGGYRGLSAFLGTEGWSHILRVLALGSDTRKTNPLAGLKTSEANSRAVRNLASTCEAWAQARLLLN